MGKRRRADSDSDSDEDTTTTTRLPFKNRLKSVSVMLSTLKTLTAATKFASTSKILTLTDLSLSYHEVTDLPLSSVQNRILNLNLTKSILASKGFSFCIPSRAAMNQLYVPELDRIILKDKSSVRLYAPVSTVRKTAITTRILSLMHQLSLKNIHVTKLDLFYIDVKLFQDQILNVVAAEKGVVVGRLVFWAFITLEGVIKGEQLSITKFSICPSLKYYEC